MNAPNNGLIALEMRIESGQSSLQAVHASRRAHVNLIEVALLVVTNRAKALVSLVFSVAS